MREPHVIVAGCGAICAVGAGLPALREAIRSNRSGLRENQKFTPPRFQSGMLGTVPEDAMPNAGDDPAFHLAVTALSDATAQAREELRTVPPERLGLVFSTTKANIETLERLAEGRPCSDEARRHLKGDLLASDLAERFGCRGPVQCVSLACVSGLVAIQQGARFIQRGSADAVLVVGADHLSSFVVAGFSALKALDPAGCRPFDRDRAGLSPGEAGAAIVLVRASSPGTSAVRVLGWGASNDANHLTGPSRDGAGLTLAIRAALEHSGLKPSEVDYINAHGTGTPYNDAMEALAIRAVFGESPPPVSASKGFFGHTLGAAGILESIVCVLAMEENFLPATPRLSTPAEGAPASLVATPRPVPSLKTTLKLGTGFGGINGALVLQKSNAG